MDGIWRVNWGIRAGPGESSADGVAEREKEGQGERKAFCLFCIRRRWEIGRERTKPPRSRFAKAPIKSPGQEYGGLRTVRYCAPQYMVAWTTLWSLVGAGTGAGWHRIPMLWYGSTPYGTRIYVDLSRRTVRSTLHTLFAPMAFQ